MERGGDLAEHGKMDAAKADFAAARKLNPSLAQQWHSTRAANYESGPNANAELCLLHWNEAIAALSRLGQHVPPSTPRPNLSATEELRQSHRRLDAGPGRSSARRLLTCLCIGHRAECFALTGESEKATRDLIEVLKANDISVTRCFRSQITSLEQARKWRAVLLYANAWLSAKPSVSQERFTLALVECTFAVLHRYPDALAACQRLMLLRENIAARNTLGQFRRYSTPNEDSARTCAGIAASRQFRGGKGRPPAPVPF